MINHWSHNRLFCLAIVFGAYYVLPITALSYQPPNQRNGTTSNRAPVSNRTAAAPGAHTISETYDVVSVGDDIQVVSKSGLITLKKQIKDEYAQELKQYQLDKKDKNRSNLKKPIEKKFTTLKPNFKNQEDAQKWAEDKIKERDKASQKK
jgi:hypothetical protein